MYIYLPTGMQIDQETKGVRPASNSQEIFTSWSDPICMTLFT